MFLSLVDREVDVLHSLVVFFCFYFYFYFLVRKIPFTGIKLTSQRVRRLRGHV